MAFMLPSDEELPVLCEGAQGILKLSDKLLVKFGIDMTPAVATTQFYVWEHADPNIICIPRPYRYFQDKSRGPSQTVGYLVMENVSGTDMSTYLESASIVEEEEVVSSIITVLDHLSKLPVPAGQGPGPVGGGSPVGYLWSDSGVAVSFASNLEMEDWLNKLLSEYAADLIGEKLHFASADLVMCHTDLAPRNILRLSDGRLALLD